MRETAERNRMNNFQDHPAFRQMDENKQKMIVMLAESVQGKKLTEALPMVMAWNERMKQENISFTQEENKLLTEIFTSQMTPEQRRQYEFMKPFMK